MCNANHQPANDKRERANRAEPHVFDGSGNDGVSMSLRGNDSLVLNNLGAHIINRTSLLADLLLQFAMRGDHLLTGQGISEETVIVGLDIQLDRGAGQGQSAVTVSLIGSPGVVFRGVRIGGGTGGVGEAGSGADGEELLVCRRVCGHTKAPG